MTKPNVEGPWANQPERQLYFVGDVVEVDLWDVSAGWGKNQRRVVVETCRVEAAYAPQGGKGWRYSLRPVGGPNPHAFPADQREIRPRAA